MSLHRHSPRCFSFLVSALLPWITLTALGQSFGIVNSTGTASANALALANNIKGTGIQSFSNLSLTAHIGSGSTKSSDSSSAGAFTGGQGIIGISSGIVLSSGGSRMWSAPTRLLTSPPPWGCPVTPIWPG